LWLWLLDTVLLEKRPTPGWLFGQTRAPAGGVGLPTVWYSRFSSTQNCWLAGHWTGLCAHECCR
jgi:hypothetical protein